MSSTFVVKRICEYCNKEFNARKTTTRFCSKTCNSRHHKKKIRETKVLQVEHEYKVKKLSSTSLIDEINVKPYLTIKDACILLGASDSTIRKLIKNGKIKTLYLGGKHIIRKSDIEGLFVNGLKE